MVVLFFPVIAWGEVKESPDIEYPKADYLTDSFLVTLGIVTQFPVTHELGHYLGGQLVGKNLKVEKIEMQKVDEDLQSNEKNTIAISGFSLPLIVSEITLDTNIPKNNPYVMGLILGPLLHNTVYIIRDSTGVTGKANDFEMMNKAGLKRSITYPLALILPVIQVWRLTQNKDFKKKWNVWMGIDRKEIVVGLNIKF